VRPLGSGGFSDVYLYEQELPHRLVAVKVLLGADELGDSSRRAFIGEANVMAQMSSHPYIVTIFHADVASDGRPYFVMEYAPGRSLGERYRREEIPVEEALRTGIRIAGAVATAHSVGILHRDIKPANILTNAFGWPALTDFGISSAVDDELADVVGRQASAAAGSGVAPPTAPHPSGTQPSGPGAGMSVPWSPPEMFDDDPQPDVRSDVYSLGATIHTLLAGRTPFEVRGRRNGTIDLIGRIERGDIQPIDRPDVPRTLVSALHRAMAVKPRDRYATAVEFARALQRVELELGYLATAIDVPTPGASSFPLAGSAGPEGSGGVGARPGADAEDGVDADPDRTRLRSAPAVGARLVHGGSRSSDEGRTMTRAVARIAAGRAADADPPTARSGRVEAAAPAASPAPAAGRAGDAARTPGPAGPTAQADGSSPAPHPAASIDPALASAGAVRDRGRLRARRSSPSRRRIVLGAVAVGVLAVLALAVVLGLVARSDAPGADPAGGTRPTASPALVNPAFPPAPVDPVAVRMPDGTIAFSWGNPDPHPGDISFWSYADGSEPARAAEGTSVTVGPFPAETKVCIQVEIRRDGRVSADRLSVCAQPASARG